MAMSGTAAKYSWMKVVDVMTKDPLSVTVTESIGVADELMTENKIRQLPVLSNGTLVGIVTDRDIRSFLSGSLLASAEEREKALSVKVGEIMTSEPLRAPCVPTGVCRARSG